MKIIKSQEIQKKRIDEKLFTKFSKRKLISMTIEFCLIENISHRFKDLFFCTSMNMTNAVTR